MHRQNVIGNHPVVLGIILQSNSGHYQLQSTETFPVLLVTCGAALSCSYC